TNFTFRSSFGITDGNNQVRNYKTKDSLTTVQHSSISILERDTASTRKWVWDNTLSYEKTFDKHRIKALIGYSSSEDRFLYDNWSVNGVPDNGEASYLLSKGDPTTLKHSFGGNRATFISYFARFNYAYNDKYLLTATIRRDGSSKFPKDNRFDNFPSFGAGWIITKEEFMKNQHVFDNLKLKGSWGKLGNANIPTNISVATVDSGGVYNYGFGGTTSIIWHGANNTRFPPKSLVWEVVKESDIGLEMASFHNRLFIEMDYYSRQTDNAIFSLPILGTVGASNSSILGNFATYNNKGFEFSANWKESTGKFKYNIGVNLSTNKNQVINILGGNVDLYGGGLPVGGYLTTLARIGQPIGSFYGFVVDGVFQTNAEAAASAQPQAKAGYFKYKDQNGDKAIDAKDKVIIGNPNPKLTYGINSGFEFKHFDLQLDLQGVAGVDVYNAMKGVRYGNENYTEDFYNNRWHGAGTSNTYPLADLSGPNLDPNSWFVEKGDYIRIRNAQLGYTFSNTLLKKWKLQKLRLYLNAQNPLTIFGYKGFTPEVGGAPMSTGIDLNVYPLSATYNFGINLTF
ncbi:MAG TPA: SusC/RagA family TonB-linked outer membrane protein, partial [Chitinophagaceae bacterium]